MSTIRQATALLSFAVLVGGAQTAAAQFYAQHNLVSDQPGVADLQDTSLVNAWGLGATATSPWWVANNGTGTSTLYNTSGPVVAKLGLTVTIPGGKPTGLVANCGTGFPVTAGGVTASSRFIFAGEDGSISGWNPGVPPPATSMKATIAIQPSDKIYKGLAIACTTPGGDFLYATDFHHGKVDVYNSSFTLQTMPGAFSDPNIPKGYAPFGIQNIGGTIYVTYALQDEDAEDDVAGVGHGYVNAFTTAGGLIRRVASKGTLNSPWGLAMSPAGFGKFSSDLLVGNFGDGLIQAFDANGLRGDDESRFLGLLHSANGPPLKIDGLWALQFGNGAAAGPKSTLFFTAGPDDESHGLFGSLVVTTPPNGDQSDND